MKVIYKLAWRNLLTNYKRTLFTLLCVILSISLIGAVLGIADSLLHSLDFEGNADNERATKGLCVGFVITSCFMSCFAICTAFSISMQERIKSFGFLTSIGMSDMQKSLLVLTEASIYGIVGVLCGTALGFGIASLFYRSISDIFLQIEGNPIGPFVLSGISVFISIFLGLLTVLIASFFPMFRMKKLSVTETIKENIQINIALKQTCLSLITEKWFGKLGLLAGQNYDNNKTKYRSISFALSGGTIMYITIYSFFKYPFWYAIDKGRGTADVEKICFYLLWAAQVLAAFFVFVFLFCSLGSIHQNIEQRKREFAMYKSMGMQNTELQKMMSIESLFFTWYSIWFGFIGAWLGDFAVCNFYRIVGPSDLQFHFPIHVFGAFVLLDFVVGFLFSVYTRHKVRKVNIIEAIRSQ